ncbi:MAG: GtrA family protein [Candidatus Doudnabacteria bacterium]|nr:GtrA family protein [Candidatus Doudnabacteria bacterium]
MDNLSNQSINTQSLIQKITGILESKPVILQFLKFAGIGFLTTAVDFLVLNLISKSFSVNVGLKLGGINLISFVIALAHSYIWNGNWTFGAGDGIAAFRSFWRAILIGAIGVIGISLAVVGGKTQASPIFYLSILGILALAEIVVWKSFSLGWFNQHHNADSQTIAAFIAVSVIGTLINSGLVSLITEYWPVSQNLDFNKNIAKIIATVFSLVWNFVGYKVFVFKK